MKLQQAEQTTELQQKVDDLCHDFNIYLWNGCGTFTFNNQARRPKARNIYFFCKNTHKIVKKYSTWKFMIVLTKKLSLVDVVFVCVEMFAMN